MSLQSSFLRSGMGLTDIVLGDDFEVLNQRFVDGGLTHEEYSKLCKEFIELGVIGAANKTAKAVGRR